MDIRRFSLFVVLGIWGLVGACGFADVEFDDPIDRQRETCRGEDCDVEQRDGGEVDEPGDATSGETGGYRRSDRGGRADSENGEDPGGTENGENDGFDEDGAGNPGDADQDDPDDSNGDQDGTDDQSSGDDYDLQCADDDDICRFCGPPEDVVTECPEGDGSFTCQVFELVNEERADHGLDELEYDGTLAESAMIHAMDLSQCDYFAHDSLDGTTFFERCEDNGYSGVCTGENIGGGQSTPRDVVEAWMESPGHRDNILYEHHTEIGVAYHEGDGSYGEYWLTHFGRE